MKISVSPYHALTVIGMTGSGKTFLLKHMISQLKPNGVFRCIIYDTKQTGDFDQYHTVRHLSELHKAVEKNFIVCYAPTHDEMPHNNMDYFDGLCAWIYARTNTLLVIDELSSVVDEHTIPDGFRDLMDRGRAKKTRIWGASQRPISLPHQVLSEVDKLFVFDLLQDSARRKLAKNISDKLLNRAGLKSKYGFYYYSRELLEPIYVKGIQV